MAMNKFLTLIFISVTICLCKINFDSSIDIPSTSNDFLEKFHEIEVEATSDTTDADEF